MIVINQNNSDIVEFILDYSNNNNNLNFIYEYLNL